MVILLQILLLFNNDDIFKIQNIQLRYLMNVIDEVEVKSYLSKLT